MKRYAVCGISQINDYYNLTYATRLSIEQANSEEEVIGKFLKYWLEKEPDRIIPMISVLVHEIKEIEK